MPSFPYGWYQVAYSDDLALGQVSALRYFGRDFVLFRTESGTAHILDAHCPHLGAHLGHGGKVKGESIRCPFHGWRFSSDGACIDIPRATVVPEKAKVGAWPLCERNGMILIYFHPRMLAPEFEVPDLEETRSLDWFPYVKRSWTIRTHIQEALENIVDQAHFENVHQTISEAASKASFEGHRFRSRSAVKVPSPQGHLVDGEIVWDAYGMGFGAIRFTGVAETLMLNTVTPVDEERVEVRFSFLSRKSTPPGLATAMINEISRQLEQDIPIWENKIYRPKPILCAGEGDIITLRRWSEQFLEPFSG